jgi:hypothetical protein
LPEEKNPESLVDLGPQILGLLRQLATQNLELLGVSDSGPFIEQEMLRSFSALAKSVGSGENREEQFREAIRRAIDEIGD